MNQSAFCTNQLTAPGMLPYGQIGGGYLVSYDQNGIVVNTGDVATIKWTDLNNSNYCWNYQNPAIKEYHIQVFQDGNLFKDIHSYKHGSHTIGGLAEFLLGGDIWWEQFNAPFGHNYTVKVSAVSQDGASEVFGPDFAFNQPAPVPIVPVTAVTTPGKVIKKK